MLPRTEIAIPIIVLVGCSPWDPPQPPVSQPQEAPRTTQLRIHERGTGAGTVILLHGYGVYGSDLVPLAEELASRVSARFVVPEAPQRLPGQDGRLAWFDPPRSRFAGREPKALRQRIEARRQIQTLVEQLGSAPLVLGGFSQGAMMAIDVAAHTDRNFRGLAILSGAALPDLPRRPPLKTEHPVFVSHGRSDPVIPFADGLQLRDMLRTGSATIEWHPFDGGHEITPVLTELTAYLRRAFASPRVRKGD